MLNKYVFHCTTKGYSHIRNGTVCEDFSDSYEDSKKQYYIAAVADGHGDPKCFRSERGAKFAVTAAISSMKAFAEELLGNERFFKQFLEEKIYQQNRMRALTNEIYYQWEENVLSDYKADYPMREILEQYKYSDEDIPLHIYGTTLIAELWLPQCLVMIHQGDGRCEIIYNDGTIEQPIPWDERCFEEKTTSLCNQDVLTSFRHCVIDFAQRTPSACYICSDGVEDSYRDTYENMKGVHTFFKDLTCQILNYHDNFQGTLSDILDEVSKCGRFSKKGSEDDVSVAGIVDIGDVQALKEQFTVDVKKYALEEELFWKEEEIRGKTRKHGILLKKMNEAKKKMDSINKEIQNLETEQENKISEHEILVQKTEQAKSELEQLMQENNEGTADIVLNPINSNFNKGCTPVWEQIQQGFRELFDNSKNKLENQYMQLCISLSESEAKIKDMQEKHQKLKEELSLMFLTYSEATTNFTEYDAKYQELEVERQRIVKEITDLTSPL